MPRPRLNQQQQQQHHFSPNALHQLQQQQTAAAQLLLTSQPQQYQPQQQFSRGESLVQRSQGVIFLSSNKAQTSVPPLAAPQTTSVLSHHQHAPIPAHQQQLSSVFQQQNMPTFVPSQIMQNPFYPYYHPVPPVAPVAVTPSVLPQQLQQSNEAYIPNGAVNYEENYMQTPPPPIKKKARRRSRRRVMESDSSDDSDDDDLLDDNGDPDWNPNANQDIPPEPIIQETPTRRGRGRGSTPRGGGRGRGRGRGRGGVQTQETPPALINQTANLMPIRGRRSTRNSRSGLSMPSLEPQNDSDQMSFGELVSAAVQSLNDPQSEHGHSSSKFKRQKQTYVAKLHKQQGYYSVERIPVSSGISLFLYVDTSHRPSLEESEDDLGLEGEEEDLILSYEIIQDEDKNRSFLCEACGHPSKSRILHNRHLVTHDSIFRFACCICSKLFSSHDQLKPHLRTHHGKGIFICPDPDCEGIFQERKSLDDHEFACHPDARPHVCRFCFDRFPTVEDSSAHEDSHPEETTASCMKCGVTYNQKSLLKEHYNHMHEEQQCKYCEEKFENKPALDEHQHEKHAELIKPPTPEAPPSPIAIAVVGDEDDDPTYSPPSGGDDDDDDDEDILVVEDRTRPIRRTRSSKKLEIKTPEPKKTVKFKDWKASQEVSSPSPSKSLPKPRPGPASSKKHSPHILKKTPVVASKSVVNDGDVITLSSDDEKDPQWKVPKKDSTRSRTTPSTATKRLRSPTKKQTEYFIVVESNEENVTGDKSATKGLTFVVGDSGELTHVPSSSDPHPPDSLPMKEIMEIIKSKQLSENTTIVIEDDKIASVQSTDVYNKSNKPSTSRKRSISKTADDSSSRWVRPGPENLETNALPTKSGSSTKSTSSVTSDKPPKLVAKKRTGGLPASNGNSTKDNQLSSSSQSGKRISDNHQVSKPATPTTSKPSPGGQKITARKRTGGSQAIYNGAEKIASGSISNKLLDDDDLQIIEETTYKSKSTAKHSSYPAKKSSEELRDPLADDDTPVFMIETSEIIKPKPVRSTPTNVKTSQLQSKTYTSTKGKGKKTPSSNKDSVDMRLTKQLQNKDYDEAPKRSLRIALKASVAETNFDESQDSNDMMDMDPLEVAPPPRANHTAGKGKRGRPSGIVQNNSNSKSSTSTISPGNSNSEGQIVMKALVNGIWQDVVIGTKLTSEDGGSVASSSRTNSTPSYASAPKVNSRSGPRNRKQSLKAAVIPAPKPRGGGRKGGPGKKAKNKPADPNADCWNDDRYQYFSNLNPQTYPVPESMPYGDFNHAGAMSEHYEGEGDGTILPFSLSSLVGDMNYQEEPKPSLIEDNADGGFPVIVSAYHVGEDRGSVKPDPLLQESFTNFDDEDDQIDEEVPMEDPLAMDSMETDVGSFEPTLLEQEPEQQDEDEPDEDPLTDTDPTAHVTPAPVVAPKKGTVQEAKFAISNLRDVLSKITFKK